jgi:hypothetical protein
VRVKPAHIATKGNQGGRSSAGVVLGVQRRAPSISAKIKQRKNGKTPKSATISTPIGVPLQGVIRPQRSYAWSILPNLAAITPQYLQGVLRGALMGFQVAQW